MGCLVSLLIENGVLASQVVYEDPVPVLRSALEYLPRYLPTWSHTFHGSWCRHGWEPIYYLLSTHAGCRLVRLVARYPLFVQTLLFAREHFYPEMVRQATTQCGTIFRQILCGNVMLPVVRDKQYQSLPFGWNLRRPKCTVKLQS